MNDSTPAYDRIAARFAVLAEDNAYNAHYERPATLSLLPDVAALRVLDAGCGPGLYARILVDRGARVVGVDASAEMLRLAAKRVPEAELHLADLAAPLPFADAAFDAVVSPLAIDHLRDWRPVLRELARVLAPGGVLVFSVGHPMRDIELSPSGRYFETERVEGPWPSFGDVVPFWRRPLDEIIAPVLEAGLVLDRLLEPRPTDELRARFPEKAAKLDALPAFLCVRALRPPDRPASRRQ
jgi:SAM-dependent methyltransferase